MASALLKTFGNQIVKLRDLVTFALVKNFRNKESCDNFTDKTFRNKESGDSFTDENLQKQGIL